MFIQYFKYRALKWFNEFSCTTMDESLAVISKSKYAFRLMKNFWPFGRSVCSINIVIKIRIQMEWIYRKKQWRF